MADQLDDSGHPIRLTSPLKGDLVVYSMTGVEEMGRLFEFNLQLLSFKSDIPFSDIVGKRITVALDLAKGERHFDGFITQFRYTGSTARYATYEATVRPWLWFLTRTADCRIFQEQSVPDIIKSVFRDNGMSEFDDRLNGKYRNWIYCAQYRETDFNFVSRLMEQEGIYYYFEHEMGKHTLVLADDLSAHSPFPGNATVPYFPPSGGMSVQTKDHIQHLTVTQAIQPGKYAVADYDFEKPKVELLFNLEHNRDHDFAIPDPEIFDYPGEYKESRDGENYVELRLHELQSQHERIQGEGPVRVIAPGCLFTLEDHPRDDLNKEFLVISVSHRLQDTQYISGGGKSEELYRCQMEIMDKDEPFRSARITPKPIVQGCQSAVVVGPSSDEIYTDEYGRIKVQFHWDRYGKDDENSSCWIRVSQAWAGKEWGSMHIPRIGQEVIVSFMEGDPDQPVITGRLYNAENMPPYGLESNKTQSGIKSRSTKGATADNFNEIRMEDKKGSEELYIQAEKNENILVKNNKGETVGNNETISIGNDREETVGHNETITVKNDRQELVQNDESLTVSKNRTRNVGKNETVVIGQSRTHEVKKDESVKIGQNLSTDVVKNQSIGVGKDRALIVEKNHSISVADSENHEVGKKLEIDVGDSILLKCGAASISLKKNGDIKIEGKNLVLKGSAKINVKASSSVTIKGSQVLKN